MRRLSIHNVNFEDLEDLEFDNKLKKKTKHAKFKENNDDTDIYESQRMPSRRRTSDDSISK